MMYFSNCDERGDQHLGGTVQLIEHLYHEQCYRSTGYFADLKEESGTTKFYPYENQFHPVFEKKTRGLKIIIPYLRSEFDNEDEIIKTVCDSFFISILDGQLEVHINDHVINANTIENYVKDSILLHPRSFRYEEGFHPIICQNLQKRRTARYCRIKH